MDHNVSSLDGRGTVHGMGIIACSMEKKIMPDQKIKRPAKVRKSSDVAKRVRVIINGDINMPLLKKSYKRTYKILQMFYQNEQIQQKYGCNIYSI